MLLQPNGKRKKGDTDGLPNMKKLERTGEDTFVVKADGGNYFEGKITDPKNVRFKPSGKIYLTSVGICVKHCINRGSKCSSCYRFSNLLEEKNAS